LGLDYGWEWKTTAHSVIGGHFGAAANQQWEEFLGAHGFWNAPYWFKSNALVDGSLFHEFSAGRAWFQSELMALEDRNTFSPDSAYVRTWGLSLLGNYRFREKWAPFARYEFFAADDVDPTHVAHFVTLGARWTPAGDSRRPFWIFQYVRPLEHGFKNRAANDVFYAQLQAEF
jgi:hypothetical protein